jgi:hypothetical protein
LILFFSFKPLKFLNINNVDIPGKFQHLNHFITILSDTENITRNFLFHEPEN